MAIFAVFAVAYECLSIGLQLSSVGLSKIEVTFYNVVDGQYLRKQTVIAMFALIWFCVFAAINIFMWVKFPGHFHEISTDIWQADMAVAQVA